MEPITSLYAPLLPPALSERAREQLDRDLRKYRRRLASRQLAWAAASADAAASEPLATQYLVALAEEFLTDEPTVQSQWLDHWGELFSILRLRSAPPHGESRLAARRNLAAGVMFLAAELRRRATVEMELDARGRMLDTRSGAWIRPPLPAGVPLIASSNDGGIELREADRPLAPAVALDGFAGTVEAIPRLGGTTILLFDDPAALGLPAAGAGAPVENCLPFVESVTRAMEILGALAPPWREWIEALVPALICMGPPPPNSDSRSESYGAGFPICLSQVHHPFKHAEDLVHECQHHRFHLWAQDLDWSTLSVATCEFVSPYRGDPRPLYGLHLGLHAFTVVNELRFDALDAAVLGRSELNAILRTHCGNLFTWATLSEFEPAGGEVERYLDEAAAALVRHHSVLQAHVSATSFREMQERFSEHVARVSRSCGSVRNDAPRYTQWDATFELARNRVGSSE